HGTRADLHVDCFLQTCTLRKSLPGPKPIAASISALTEAARTMWVVPKNVWRFATGSLRPSPGIRAGVLQFHDALARGVAPPVPGGAGAGRRAAGRVGGGAGVERGAGAVLPRGRCAARSRAPRERGARAANDSGDRRVRSARSRARRSLVPRRRVGARPGSA